MGPGITVVPSSDVRIHPQADVPFMAMASLVLVIVGLVLAIACSNLATLLLVRGAARAKEVSVRLAMGATRRQLVRHLLMESLLLSLAGGIAGCILAWWGMRALQAIDLPFRVDMNVDYRVLAFAIALSLVTGVVFGLAPAIKATRVDLLQTLRDEGLQPIDHRRLTLKNALIVVQVAVSVLLLGGTSIFMQAVSATRALRVGYAVDGVAMLETDARFAGYSESAAKTMYDDLLRRVQAIPGVEAATLLRGLPMASTGMSIVADSATGQPGSEVETVMLEAGPGFFETLRIPLLYGRTFDARDRADTPRVAVITEAMARKYFGTVDASGRRFRLQNDPNSWTEVIGVVRDTGTGDLEDDILAPIKPKYYRSHTQSGAQATTIVARTSRDAESLLAAMQRELRAVDITLPVMTAKTMAQARTESETAPAVVATFLGDPRRPRSGAGQHRSLCRRRVCGGEAVARDRHPHGARRPQSAGRVEHRARRHRADRRWHRHRSLPHRAVDAGAAHIVGIGRHRDRQHDGVSPEHRSAGAAGHRRGDRPRRRRGRIRAGTPRGPHAPARRAAPRVAMAIKEAARDARGTGAWDAVLRDTRQGIRRLVRDWRFTTAAVLILGLAIGANTAIFSLVNAVLFREQAFADPDRLVNIYQNDRAGRPLVVTSYSAYMEMAEYTDIFAATMAATIPMPVRYLRRRRHPRCGRRVRDGDISRHPGTPAVARPLVRRDGGTARGSARRRPRTSDVDPRVPRGPIRPRTRHPDRRRAGDDRRRRSCQSPRHG